jgi:MYXO-CTERM domain-containing protein
MNIRHLIIPAFIALIASAGTASAQLFTTGDLVVSTYGSLTSASGSNGGTVITDGATPITLIEYNVTNPSSPTFVLSDQLPTTGVDGNVGIQGEDGSSSEGTIQLSGNGEYLTIGGYDGNAANNGIQAATNTANGTDFADGTAWNSSTIALAQSSDVDVPRVAATIDAYGNVNTSTLYTGPYNTNNPRAVYSPDGTNFYLSGQGSGVKVNGVYTDQGGIYTTTLGTTGTANTTPIFIQESTRDVLQYGGNTYYSADQNSKKGVLTGIFEYSGSPTTNQGSSTGTRITPVSGTIYNGGGFTGSGGGTAVNFSPQDFAFANATTLYVADTGTPKAGGNGDGGIQKWSFADGTWGLDYTLTPTNFVSATVANASATGGETGFADLAIQVVGNNVDIFGVSYTQGPDSVANGLYGVVDSLSNTDPTVGESETISELEESPGTAGTDDYNFKGVSFAPTVAPVPEPGTWGMALGGLGMLVAWQRRRATRK